MESVILNVLDVYESTNPNWMFLFKNVSFGAPPQKIIRLDQHSLDWADRNIPDKIIKKNPDHIMIICRLDIKIPTGYTRFNVYDVKTKSDKIVKNIEFSGSSEIQKEASNIDLNEQRLKWEELKNLFSQREEIDNKIKVILCQLKPKF